MFHGQSCILGEQSERVRRLVGEHRSALDALASALVDHESLDGDDSARVVEQAEQAVVARLRPLDSA